MLRFYELFHRKLAPAPAMYFFLLVNIAFWFSVGAFSGMILAFFFSDVMLILPSILTTGALFALTVGYVYGYITVIRNS